MNDLVQELQDLYDDSVSENLRLADRITNLENAIADLESSRDSLRQDLSDSEKANSDLLDQIDELKGALVQIDPYQNDKCIFCHRMLFSQHTSTCVWYTAFK